MLEILTRTYPMPGPKVDGGAAIVMKSCSHEASTLHENRYRNEI